MKKKCIQCDKLYKAILKYHSQKGDDRCIRDDDELYAAAGLPPADHHVGDPLAMAQNCIRFIKNRCQGGKWPSYAQLEAKNQELIGIISKYIRAIDHEPTYKKVKRSGLLRIAALAAIKPIIVDEPKPSSTK